MARCSVDWEVVCLGFYLNGFTQLFTTMAAPALLAGVVLGIIIGVLRTDCPPWESLCLFRLLIMSLLVLGFRCLSEYSPAESMGVGIGDLLKTPGTPADGATILDGYPMAQSGQAGKAIAIAYHRSAIGGLIGALILSFLAPQIAKIAVRFGPPELCAAGCVWPDHDLLCRRQVFDQRVVRRLYRPAYLKRLGSNPSPACLVFSFGTLNLLTGFELFTDSHWDIRHVPSA